MSISPITAATSQGSAPTGPVGGTLGQDEFLRLFVTQLRNQDPLNPQDGQEFIAQLAQFSSLEQLVGMRGEMGDVTAASRSVQATVEAMGVMNALGSTVIAHGDQITVADGEPTVAHFALADGAAQATVEILDSTGRVVSTVDLGALDSGRNRIDLTSSIGDLPPGDYSYRIEAKDASGGSVDVATFMSVRIDGIRYGSEGPVFTSGNHRIPLGEIVEIRPSH